MNEFLKYLKMIPVIIYPYIYVLILAVFFLFVGVLPEDTTDISLLVLLIIAVIYNLYSFVIVIVNAVQTARGKLTAGQAARMNLIIKGIQIPAYIMHFILGFIGLAMSVWGIGFLLWAVLIDLLTILLTGISSIGCSIRMRKERLVSLPGAIFMGIGCFIYCADVNFLRKVMSSSRHDGAAYSRHPCRQSADADIVSAFPLPFSTFLENINILRQTSSTWHRIRRKFCVLETFQKNQ